MSNRLPILAAEIRQAHLDTLAAEKTAAERAIAAGEALSEAKALAKHGEWLPFLKAAGVPERTAQRYMRLAASRLKSDTVTVLGGIGAALRFIRLRELARGQIAEAEAAARDGRAGTFDELVPIEAYCMLLDMMVDMFPPEIGKAGGT